MPSEIVPHGATVDQILEGPEGDLLRSSTKKMLAEVIEGEAAVQIGSALHERVEGRAAHTNGHREREVETRVGSLSLAIPKLRAGTYFLSFRYPRQTPTSLRWGTSTTWARCVSLGLAVDS